MFSKNEDASGSTNLPNNEDSWRIVAEVSELASLYLYSQMPFSLFSKLVSLGTPKRLDKRLELQVFSAI